MQCCFAPLTYSTWSDYTEPKLSWDDANTTDCPDGLGCFIIAENCDLNHMWVIKIIDYDLYM